MDNPFTPIMAALAELTSEVRELRALLAAPVANTPEFGNAEFAARTLGCTVNWVREHMHIIPHSKPNGKHVVFLRSDLIAFQQRRFSEGRANTTQVQVGALMQRTGKQRATSGRATQRTAPRNTNNGQAHRTGRERQHATR